MHDRGIFHWEGHYGWHHYRPIYGLGGYYGYNSYSPSSSAYYPYYGSYPYDASTSVSGSSTDQGDSSSSYQAAPSSGGSSAASTATTAKETTTGERPMDRARRAFQKGDYAEAQRQCEGEARVLPGDANLYQFHALCQFAQGKYQDAAATLYEVLAAGPGWHWTTLSSFYTSAEAYTRQLRALERYVRDNPKDAAGHFVLMYHYLALDQRDAAVGQAREIIKIQPKDQVSPHILAALK